MSSQWVFTIFCPAIGCIICNAMFYIQLQSVLLARKHKKLGTTSPYPFAILTICQLGWTAYAYMARDYFIFFSSAAGVVTGMLSCFTAIHLLERPHHSHVEEDERLWVENILLIGFSYWISILFVASIILIPSSATSLKMIGGSAAGCSILYYGVPLTSMRDIIHTKDASRLYLPTILINLANSSLWFIYGLALGDVAVYLPNTIGATLTTVQLVLYFMYPSQPKAFDAIEKDEEDPPNSSDSPMVTMATNLTVDSNNSSSGPMVQPSRGRTISISLANTAPSTIV